jgi:hypothetical protein
MAMSDTIDGLPPTLQDDWVDALATGSVTPRLAQWLEANPSARHESEELGNIAKLLCQDRDSMDPGEHYFEALAQDVMEGIAVQTFVGEKPNHQLQVTPSLWARTKALFAKHPTLGWGAVMAAALTMLLVSSLIYPPKSEPPHRLVTAADAGASEKGSQSNEHAWLLAALPENLSSEEIQELRMVAAQVQLGDFAEEAGLDDEWGFAAGAGAIESMGIDDLTRVEEALEAPL